MIETINKTEYETLSDFRYMLRKFLHFSEEAAEAVGLTPTQHQALLAVMGFPGRDYVTIGELAERLQIRHNSAVGLVNRLVSQGLLVRVPAIDDRRRVYLRLTPQGAVMLEKLAAAHKQELRNIGPRLNQILTRLTQKEDE